MDRIVEPLAATFGEVRSGESRGMEEGLGVRVQGLGFGFRVQLQGLGFRVQRFQAI